MEVIGLSQISHAYPGRPEVLSGLDFSLGRGERIGVMGPNGSGKSTMLAIIMGLIKPVSGQVRLFERTCKSEADFAELRPRVGFCFQDADDQLFSPTVLEDVAFGPLNLGLGRREARLRAGGALEMVGLSGFEQRITYHLSGGEKRLVSLASVLSMQPEALILDEPTTGLDEDSQARVEQILNDMEIPFLVVSHDRGFVSQICRRTLTMRRGKLTG